jgi:hypothetical protein
MFVQHEVVAVCSMTVKLIVVAVAACLVQHITLFCSNEIIEKIATFFSVDYSTSKLASISVNWCATADSSLIYKLGSFLGNEEIKFPNRSDWKALLHLIGAFWIIIKIKSFLAVFHFDVSVKLKPFLLFWIHYLLVVGSLVLFSNLFHFSGEERFTIGLLSLPVFVVTQLVSDNDSSQFTNFVRRWLVCSTVVMIWVYQSFTFWVAVLCLVVGLSIVLVLILKYLPNIIDKAKYLGDLCDRKNLHRLKDCFSWLNSMAFSRVFIDQFFLQDSLIMLRLVSTLIACSVPFSTFYEIIFEISSVLQQRFLHICLLLLAWFVFTFVHMIRECAASDLPPEEVENLFAKNDANKPFFDLLLMKVSVLVVALNTLKFFALRTVLKSTTAPSFTVSWMCLCDVFALLAFVYYIAHLPKKSNSDEATTATSEKVADKAKSVPVTKAEVAEATTATSEKVAVKAKSAKAVCIALVLIGLNNLFFMTHDMPPLLESSTFFDLFSNSLFLDVESLGRLVYSFILHAVPVFKFLRLIWDQFFTIFEDVSRLTPAELLMTEFDTCYVINFSQPNHDAASLNFHPMYGTATMFYQPVKNYPAIGTFVMEINGSLVTTMQLSPKLLDQPLSLCFIQSTQLQPGASHLFFATELVFRRFHRVKAKLSLPSPLVFNRSAVPWIHGTQWRATLYSEASLQPDRKRPKHPSCNSHKCRPVC